MRETQCVVLYVADLQRKNNSNDGWKSERRRAITFRYFLLFIWK